MSAHLVAAVDFAQQVFGCVALFVIGLWFLWSAVSDHRGGETVLPRRGTDYTKTIRISRREDPRWFWGLIILWYTLAVAFIAGGVVMFVHVKLIHSASPTLGVAGLGHATKKT